MLGDESNALVIALRFTLVYGERLMASTSIRNCEKVEGTFGDEIFGNPIAQVFWCGGTSSFSFDLDHGFTVRGDNLGDHPPLPFLGDGWKTMGSDRKRTSAAEGVEGNALGSRCEAGVRVIEEGDCAADGCVASFVGLDDSRMIRAASLKSESALAWSWTYLFRSETLVDGFGAVEAVEPGSSQDESIAITLFEFAKAGVDVAANLYEGDVGAESEDLGTASRTGSADAPAGGKCVESPVIFADPHVTGVGALGDGGEGKLRRELGRQVFERMNGEVDAAFFECLFNLFDEKAFAVQV